MDTIKQFAIRLPHFRMHGSQKLKSSPLLVNLRNILNRRKWKLSAWLRNLLLVSNRPLRKWEAQEAPFYEWYKRYQEHGFDGLILKAYDLVTSPVYTVVSAKDKFENPTTRINQLWQTDFSYLKVIDWVWYYLSTVMDDYSRYILAWRLCQTMMAEDVKKTLDI